eukprot:TRINITY_DN9119_c0_g2_i1.p1 TRINITY_DN9119_c0_g2~~TRINITY_DN9119_c0_g2_i1.p1  ORF type:complete len:253 (+),score=59.44 TRINITY_DN9119_c0_g2_i1:59-817(+)
MPTGKVVTWYTAKGYGFVQDEEGTSAYVHTSSIDGGMLKVGENVTYDTEESKRKGKLVAVNVKGPGLTKKKKGDTKGTVKSWNVSTSVGFIKTDDGEDVYVHRSAAGGGNLVVGKPVSFCAEDVKHKSGRKVAINVTGEGVLPIGKLTGTVKRWISTGETGYGFIEPEVKAEGDEKPEIFVHSSELSGGSLFTNKTIFYDLSEKSHDSGRKIAVNVSGPALNPSLPARLPFGRGRGMGRGGRGGSRGGRGRA